MSKNLQAIRGMNDILPAAMSAWQHFENTAKAVLRRYGYMEIRTPVVEPTALFKRSIGDATDIVEKEMYSFVDRNGDELSLRPEGTASCVRACVQHGLLYNQTQRLWYLGPMFRHERPQKGRYRQFYQMGVEAYGISTPDIEAELILLSARLWQELGLSQHIRLEINSLGNQQERAEYRQALVAYLSTYQDALDADSLRRLATNPLRILDSKVASTQAILEQAPKLSDFLGQVSQAHLQQLCEYLNATNIAYTINPKLVRGLDYYSHTVFEWITDALGAQGTVCAGGRYDELINQLGGKNGAAFGFAMGVERLVLLLTEFNAQAAATAPTHFYMLADNLSAQTELFALAERLRGEFAWLNIHTHCGGGSMKSQMKKADKSGAEFALILAQQERTNEQVTLKHLATGEQTCVAIKQLATWIKQQYQR